MSRIGKKLIPVPKGVDVKIDGKKVTVKGPKTKKPLEWSHPDGIAVKLESGQVRVVCETDPAKVKALGGARTVSAMHGLTRALVNNMITGAATPFEKGIEIYGTGYNMDVKGRDLVLNVGFVNQIILPIPESIDVEVKVKAARGDIEPARFFLRGPDKQAVGEFAAKIRRCKPPEPYKGKGIRYVGEQIRRKEGKPLVSSGG